jgi:hypothetical protein
MAMVIEIDQVTGRASPQGPIVSDIKDPIGVEMAVAVP